MRLIEYFSSSENSWTYGNYFADQFQCLCVPLRATQMMNEKTLSRLLLASTLIVTIGLILIKIVFPAVAIPGYLRYGYAVAFVAAPILLIMKLVSSIFLIALKGQPLSSIEIYFIIFYAFLTKEAREEWRSYIDDQKNKGA